MIALIRSAITVQVFVVIFVPLASGVSAQSGLPPSNCQVEAAGSQLQNASDARAVVVRPSSELTISCSTLVVPAGVIGIPGTGLLPISANTFRLQITELSSLRTTNFMTGATRLQPGNYSVEVHGITPDSRTLVGQELRDVALAVTAFSWNLEKDGNESPAQAPLMVEVVSIDREKALDSVAKLKRLIGDRTFDDPLAAAALSEAEDQLRAGRPAVALALANSSAALYTENRHLKNKTDALTIIVAVESVLLLVGLFAIAAYKWRTGRRPSTTESEGAQRTGTTDKFI